MRPDASLFAPGERIAVAVSGGADSVALLRWMAAEARTHGWVVSAAHFQHNLRGEASDGDEEFVRSLAGDLDLEFHCDEADTAARAAGRSFEDVSRTLRYAFFGRLIEQRRCDSVATAHTLDDQAETVLMKALRGAWTDGLSGIAPVLGLSGGRVVRPMLSVRRAEVEQYLCGLGHPWREDESNQDEAFLRNRVRHTVMPLLREINPEVDAALARMADIARAEEQYWQPRTMKLLADVTLHGKPVRGGGRSVSATDASLAMDTRRLQQMDLAERRRVLRAAVDRMAGGASFRDIAALEELLAGRPGRQCEMEGGVRAERSARELRMECGRPRDKLQPPPPVFCAASETTRAEAFRLRVTMPAETCGVLRVWKAGDRVRLRHTLSDSKVKDVLQRMRVTPEEKAAWPVLEVDGMIAWMRGVDMARALPGLSVTEA